MSPAKKAVVLLSGGLDSCVALSLALQDYQVAIMHANYGQRTERRELEAFHAIGDHYNIPEHHRLVIDHHFLADIGGSALTQYDIQVPDANLDSDEIPITYVPFRNANLLSAAAAWAEELGAVAIFIGAVEEDSSGYPDCRRTFFDAFEKAINEGTRPGTMIRILTPIIDLHKSEIIKAGFRLKSPLHLTWSCYLNDDEPCAKCDSCVIRERAFKAANAHDPILAG
ncbi:7-cyano-7-deazaguanine synthase QueC [Candidatus Neomarinimicrobiota bacterium]